MSSRSFDRVAERYDASRGGERRGADFAADIRRRLVPGTVLEVGVGTGVVAKALRDHGFIVYGVDLSGNMLRHAVARLGPAVVRADALRLPVAGRSVDNAVFVMALHAIGDVHGALAEAARVVRSGGRIVATHGLPRHIPAEGAPAEDADIQAEVMAVVEPLAPMRDDRPDTEDAVATAASALGLELVDLDWGAPVRFEESPNEFADGLEQRIYSYLWDVDDVTWNAVVAPVAAGLRALPEPDRRRKYLQAPRIAVYRVV